MDNGKWIMENEYRHYPLSILHFPFLLKQHITIKKEIRTMSGEYTEYRYDTQLLIEGEGLDEDVIRDYFEANFVGDCLLAVGDDELIKIHYHTNEPWKVLEYCSTLGEIYDIVVEDMDRQSRGLQG
jgi:dihydroxyacetone kinase-like predicted kinase